MPFRHLSSWFFQKDRHALTLAEPKSREALGPLRFSRPRRLLQTDSRSHISSGLLFPPIPPEHFDTFSQLLPS